MLKVLQLQNEKIEKYAKRSPAHAWSNSMESGQTSVEHGPPDRAAKLTLAYQVQLRTL